MNTAFLIVTVLFMLISLAMVLIILVQRPSGGGLAGAFGGAGGSGSDTVFGGRVGDALTWATVAAFVLYLGFAIALNLLDEIDTGVTTGTTNTSLQAPIGDSTPQPVSVGGDIPDDAIEESNSGDVDDSDPSASEVPTGDSPDDSSSDEKPETTPDDPNSEDPPGGDN